MKKIFTILAVAISSITMASAQQGRDFKNDNHDSRDISYGKSQQQASNSSYFFTERERDAEISKINREFNQKITMVQRDRWMKAKQKTSQIKKLEKQRADQIKMVQQKFASNMKKYNGYSKNNSGKW